MEDNGEDRKADGDAGPGVWVKALEEVDIGRDLEVAVGDPPVVKREDLVDQR